MICIQHSNRQSENICQRGFVHINYCIFPLASYTDYSCWTIVKCVRRSESSPINSSMRGSAQHDLSIKISHQVLLANAGYDFAWIDWSWMSTRVLSTEADGKWLHTENGWVFQPQNPSMLLQRVFRNDGDGVLTPMRNAVRYKHPQWAMCHTIHF